MLEFYSKEELYTFDDVCLVPQHSEVSSRKDVDLTHGRLNLGLPIISANMDSCTEIAMLLAMKRAGGLGVLHRFMSEAKLYDQVAQFYQEVGDQAYDCLALSVGVKETKDHLLYCTDNARIICVDIAHGHSRHTQETVETLKELNPRCIVIAGNVATPEGVEFLVKAGADIIKVGIGPGSLCSTRVVTGHGIPQLSAISMCADAALALGVETIADGGIRNAGDLAKSLAAGADYVMLGSLLAATDEAPGRTIEVDGRMYKEYRGSASFEAQYANGRKDIVPEGASQLKLAKGPVKDILFQLGGGLRSALSYSGSFTIQEFKRKAKFVRVTPSSYVEGTPHGLKSA